MEGDNTTLTTQATYYPGTGTFNPTQPSPSGIAISAFFITLTAVLAVGGLVLFWLRRQDPLVAKRDIYTTILIVVIAFLTQVSAYFDRSMPCWAYYPLNYTINACIPGLILARMWGTFARHVRQTEAVTGSRVPSHAASLVPAAGSSWEAARPSNGTTVTISQRLPGLTWYGAFFARNVLWYKLDRPRRSLLTSLVTGVPFLVYGVIRLAVSPLHRSPTNGCVYDRTDLIFSGLISFGAVSSAVPALENLTRYRDSLLMRFEVLSQLVIWPPMLCWLLADFSLTEGQHFPLSGLYGILVGALLTLVVTLWIPAICAFFRPHHRRSPSRREVRLSNLGVSDSATTTSMNAVVVNTTNSRLPRNSPSPDQATSQSLPLTQQPPLNRDTSISIVSVIDDSGTSLDPGLVCTSGSSGAYGRSDVSGSAALIAASSPSQPSFSPSLTALAEFSSHFLTPAPSATEVAAVLATPISSVLISERSISVFGAVLVGTSSGRDLLAETLRMGMCAELLGFLVDGEALWRSIMKWYRSLNANPAAPSFTGTGSVESELLFSDLTCTLARFNARYVAFGAPHYVNIGREALILSGAAALLTRRQISSPEDAAKDSSVVGGMQRALARAEVDVFERIVFEPLMWGLRSQSSCFSTWAAGILRSVAPRPQREVLAPRSLRAAHPALDDAAGSAAAASRSTGPDIKHDVCDDVL